MDAPIRGTIRSAFRDSIIVTIAHRINTILDSDVAVEMTAGQITEAGRPHDLLKNPGSAFAAMAKETGMSDYTHKTSD